MPAVDSIGNKLKVKDIVIFLHTDFTGSVARNCVVTGIIYNIKGGIVRIKGEDKKKYIVYESGLSCLNLLERRRREVLVEKFVWRNGFAD